MRTLLHQVMALIVSGTAGCATATGTTTATGTAMPNATPASAAPRPRSSIVDDVTNALLRGDFEEAAAIVARGKQAPPDARASEQRLAYLDATVHAYRGDFRGAAKVMDDHIAKVGPTAEAAFTFHNAMIALRTADGDLLGALIECEEMVRAGMLGTWTPPDVERVTLVRLKEHWHRAYLLRMIAQTVTGAERDSILRHAERARRDYVAVATPIGTLGDSIAVLDAYFAFCDGDRSKMREAALRVKIAANEDVEDLYLTQLALDGAGDSAAAAAVRKRIASFPWVTVLTPVFLAWMRSDEAASSGRAPQFSPRHPTGIRREREQ